MLVARIYVGAHCQQASGQGLRSVAVVAHGVVTVLVASDGVEKSGAVYCLADEACGERPLVLSLAWMSLVRA